MKLLTAALIVVAAVAAHFYAMDSGIYAAQLRGGVVWFDNVLHAFVGAAMGLVWLSILRWLKPTSSFLLTALSLLGFVAVLAAAWELFEYGFYLVFKSGALGLTVYEPSLNEAFFDSFSNLTGAVVLIALWAFLRKPKATGE